MRPWKSVTMPGSRSSFMWGTSTELQLAQRGVQLLRRAARLGQPQQHVARLFRKRAPLGKRKPWRARGDGLGNARGSPSLAVDRPAFERRHRMADALRESGQRLAVCLQVAFLIDGQMAHRQALGSRHRRPRQKGQLEPGEIQLAAHGERDELQRAVEVPLQLEAQVHAAPYTSANGVVTTTRTSGATRSAPSIAVYGRIPKRPTSSSTRAMARPAVSWKANSPVSSRPCNDSVPRTRPSSTSFEAKAISGYRCASSP